MTEVLFYLLPFSIIQSYLLSLNYHQISCNDIISLEVT